MNKHLYIALALTACHCGASLAAADDGKQAAAKNGEQVVAADLTGHLDLAVPQSPAFTILGVAPEKIVQSDDLRTVALGLLQGIDPQGNLQSGLAFDVRPYFLLKGDDTRLGSYQESYFVRAASSLQMSFATAAGQSDRDKADRQALAINVKLWRQHDPARMELTQADGTRESEIDYDPPGALAENQTIKGTLGDCYAAYLHEAVAPAATGAPSTLPTPAKKAEAEEKLAAGARLATKNCLEPYKNKYWNAGTLELAIAGYRSDVDDLAENGSGAWLGWSYGIGTKAQVVARASYSDNRLVAPKKGASKYTLVDETDAGLRFRYGNQRGSLMLEGLWTQAKNSGVDDEYWRGTLGGEFMVLRDVWLQLSVGKSFGTELFDKDPIYSSQLRFGFSKGSLLNARQ